MQQELSGMMLNCTEHFTAAMPSSTPPPMSPPPSAVDENWETVDAEEVGRIAHLADEVAGLNKLAEGCQDASMEALMAQIRQEVLEELARMGVTGAELARMG